MTTLIYLFVIAAPARIDYGIDYSTNMFYPVENNTISIHYTNNGGGGNFYLVLTLINGTFLEQTQQPYIQINSTTIKFPFYLHASFISKDPGSRIVFFKINKDVDGFAFALSVEGNDSKPVYDQNAQYSYLGYKWSTASNSYEQSERKGVAVVE